MKKLLLTIFLCFALTGCIALKQDDNKGSVIEYKATTAVEKPGENLPVSRALVAKILALTFSSPYEISIMDKEAGFKDVAEDTWFYPYVNAVCALGYMQGTGEEFLPNEPLSLKEAKIILESISERKIEFAKSNSNKPISCNLWTELFAQVVESKLLELELEIKNISVFATAEKGNMQPWTVATSGGALKCHGYSVDAYVDKTIKVITKEDEILGILSLEESKGEFKNAYIKKIENNKINVFFEGGSREFIYEDSVPFEVATIEVDKNEIVNIDFSENSFRDQVIVANNRNISFTQKGEWPIGDNFKVYDLNGEYPINKGISALISGSDIGKIFVKNGEVCAAVIDRIVAPETLRVVLGTTGFTGYIHREVSLASTNGMKIKYGEIVEDATEISFTKDGNKYFDKTNRVYILAEKNTPIEISSIERNWNNSGPKYYGIIEVEKRGEGFVIINEIDMETYLSAVVPSEMPSSYGLEAARVQAICARSYAYNQFYSNKFHEYGANIDDSVMCQVYNNTPANDISKTAVKDTENMYLSFNEEVISANFFSTSCGSFANSGDVWATGSNFPSQNKEYLSTQQEGSGLSSEVAFRKFIETSSAGYDTWSNWSRWKVTMTQAELLNTVEKNINIAYTASPHLVKMLQKDLIFKSRPIENLGKIKSVDVLKRGTGGNVMGIKIVGEKNTALLRTEYIIRTVLRPVGTEENPVNLILKNKDIVKNYALLPSGFFTIDITEDEEGYLKDITFVGGGNGHGVGMSQNGVKQMCKDGKTYEEILKYYYQGVEIIKK